MTTPWFFLSYSVDDRDVEEKEYVDEFHGRLVLEVSRRVGLKGAASGEIGFQDRADIELGDEWDRDIAEALRTCRVLVCLYSPNYFKSPYCRRELEIFLSRYGEYRNTANPKKRPSRVLPVLWADPDTLSENVGPLLNRIQNRHRSLGDEYTRKGLLYFKTAKKIDNWNVFISDFAKRLVAEAKDGYLPPLPDLPTLDRTGGVAQTPAGATEGAGAVAEPAAGHTAEAVVVASEVARPDKPRVLPPEVKSRDSIRLAWSGEAGAGGGFFVERCEGKDCADFAPLKQVGAANQEILDEGLTPNTWYAYRVYASDRGGASDPSDIVRVRISSGRKPWPWVGGAAILAAAIITVMFWSFRGPVDCNKLNAEAEVGRNARAHEFSDAVVRTNDSPPGVWQRKDEWDLPAKWAPAWLDAAATDGWLVVKGREPGFQNDYFGDFRLSVPVEFEKGTSAGLFLRAQGDRAVGYTGYCFIIEKRGDTFYLTYYWGSPQSRPRSVGSKGIGLTDFSGEPGSSLNVVVIARGGSFKFEFKPETAGDPISVPVSLDEFKLKAGECHPRLGRVGFFAVDDAEGDAASRFQMGSVKITPLKSEQPAGGAASPPPGA